jgi:hypothetical protein
MQKKKILTRLILAISAIFTVLFFIIIGLIIYSVLRFFPNVNFSIQGSVLWVNWRVANGAGGGFGTQLVWLVIFAIFTPIFFYSLISYRRKNDNSN